MAGFSAVPYWHAETRRAVGKGNRPHRGVIADLRLRAPVALAERSQWTLGQGDSGGAASAWIGLKRNTPGARNLERLR